MLLSCLADHWTHDRTDEGWPRDFQFLVSLYEFQKTTTHIGIWHSDAQVAPELLALLAEDRVGTDEGKIVLPLVPQPRGNSVACIVAESWNLDCLFIPVLIQVYAGPYYTFVEYFTGRVTLQDIRFCAGQLWPPGGKVYVGSDMTPLADDAFVYPVAGLLIRISPSSLIPGLTVDLDTRLSEPDVWLYDVGSHGLPEERSSSGKICVLGAWSNQHICYVDRGATSSALRQHVLEQCGFRTDAVSFCATSRQLWNFASRDVPARSVIGIIPDPFSECEGVFVDARCVAGKVQFVLLPPVPISLDNLLHLLSVSRPTVGKLVAQGSSTFDEGSGMFIPEHCSLLTMRVQLDDPVESSADDDDSSPDDGPSHSSRDGDVDTDGKHKTGDSRAATNAPFGPGGQVLLPIFRHANMHLAPMQGAWASTYTLVVRLLTLRLCFRNLIRFSLPCLMLAELRTLLFLMRTTALRILQNHACCGESFAAFSDSKAVRHSALPGSAGGPCGLCA